MIYSTVSKDTSIKVKMGKAFIAGLMVGIGGAIAKIFTVKYQNSNFGVQCNPLEDQRRLNLPAFRETYLRGSQPQDKKTSQLTLILKSGKLTFSRQRQLGNYNLVDDGQNQGWITATDGDDGSNWDFEVSLGDDFECDMGPTILGSGESALYTVDTTNIAEVKSRAATMLGQSSCELTKTELENMINEGLLTRVTDDDNTGTTDDNTGATDDNASTTDDNAGATDDNTGATDDNTGTTDDNTGATDDNTGTTDDNAGATDDNASTTDDNASATNDDTIATDDNTNTADDNAVAVNSNILICSKLKVEGNVGKLLKRDKGIETLFRMYWGEKTDIATDITKEKNGLPKLVSCSNLTLTSRIASNVDGSCPEGYGWYSVKNFSDIKSNIDSCVDAYDLKQTLGNYPSVAMLNDCLGDISTTSPLELSFKKRLQTLEDSKITAQILFTVCCGMIGGLIGVAFLYAISLCNTDSISFFEHFQNFKESQKKGCRASTDSIAVFNKFENAIDINTIETKLPQWFDQGHLVEDVIDYFRTEFLKCNPKKKLIQNFENFLLTITKYLRSKKINNQQNSTMINDDETIDRVKYINYLIDTMRHLDQGNWVPLNFRKSFHPTVYGLYEKWRKVRFKIKRLKVSRNLKIVFAKDRKAKLEIEKELKTQLKNLEYKATLLLVAHYCSLPNCNSPYIKNKCIADVENIENINGQIVTLNQVHNRLYITLQQDNQKIEIVTHCTDWQTFKPKMELILDKLKSLDKKKYLRLKIALDDSLSIKDNDNIMGGQIEMIVLDNSNQNKIFQDEQNRKDVVDEELKADEELKEECKFKKAKSYAIDILSRLQNLDVECKLPSQKSKLFLSLSQLSKCIEESQSKQARKVVVDEELKTDDTDKLSEFEESCEHKPNNEEDLYLKEDSPVNKGSQLEVRYEGAKIDLTGNNLVRFGSTETLDSPINGSLKHLPEDSPVHVCVKTDLEEQVYDEEKDELYDDLEGFNFSTNDVRLSDSDTPLCNDVFCITLQPVSKYKRQLSVAYTQGFSITINYSAKNSKAILTDLAEGKINGTLVQKIKISQEEFELEIDPFTFIISEQIDYFRLLIRVKQLKLNHQLKHNETNPLLYNIKKVCLEYDYLEPLIYMICQLEFTDVQADSDLKKVLKYINHCLCSTESKYEESEPLFKYAVKLIELLNTYLGEVIPSKDKSQIPLAILAKQKEAAQQKLKKSEDDQDGKVQAALQQLYEAKVAYEFAKITSSLDGLDYNGIALFAEKCLEWNLTTEKLFTKSDYSFLNEKDVKQNTTQGVYIGNLGDSIICIDSSNPYNSLEKLSKHGIIKFYIKKRNKQSASITHISENITAKIKKFLKLKFPEEDKPDSSLSCSLNESRISSFSSTSSITTVSDDQEMRSVMSNVLQYYSCEMWQEFKNGYGFLSQDCIKELETELDEDIELNSKVKFAEINSYFENKQRDVVDINSYFESNYRDIVDQDSDQFSTEGKTSTTAIDDIYGV